MADLVTIWLGAQAAGFIFRPILEELARDATKDWAKSFCTDALKNVLSGRSEWKESCGKAMKEFLSQFEDELVGAGETELTCVHYTEALQNFLRDAEVAEILGGVLTDAAAAVQAPVLARRWHILKLGALPTDFQWAKLCRRYEHKARVMAREDTALREILNSQNLERVASILKSTMPVVPGFDLESYARAMLRRYGRLQLEAMDSSGSYYRELELWRIFVPQLVRECHEYLPQVLELPKELLRRLRDSGQIDLTEAPSASELEALRRRYLSQTPRYAFDLVDDRDHRRLVILGDPGSGKSSLLRYLMLRWANIRAEERVAADLPLLIELRAYAHAALKNDGVRDLLDFFHQGAEAAWHLDRSRLDQLLSDVGGSVYFDGLDEVFDPVQRDEVVATIERFALRYPKARLIITSRVIGYKGERFRHAGFRHVMLEELDSLQIEGFLNQWHRDTFAPSEAVESESKKQRLALAIREVRSIRELAGNPLLLTMMAILNRYQDLPRDRAELYAECSKLLLQQWKVEEALRADPDLARDAATLGMREKEAILRRIASEIQGKYRTRGTVITADRLEEIVEEVIGPFIPHNRKAVARALIWQLRGRNFILCALGGDCYAFVHRTFLEYFCASAYVWEFEREKSLTLRGLFGQTFRSYGGDERWHEVLRLIVGQIHPKFAGEILHSILRAPRRNQPTQHIFLAASCFAEVRVRDGLADFAKDLRARLEALVDRRISLDFLPRYPLLFDHQDHRFPSMRPELDRRSLVYYPGSDDPVEYTSVKARAIRAVAACWPREERTLHWLRKMVSETSDAECAVVAIQEIGRGWLHHPDTMRWLMEAASGHAVALVRQAAVEEIGLLWKDHPEVIGWLQERGCSDPNLDVRFAAAREFAKGWRDDARLLPWLRARAFYYQGGNLVFKAVREVALRRQQDPGTVVWLKALASRDEPDWVLRNSAIIQLQQEWREDKDVAAFLKELGRPPEEFWSDSPMTTLTRLLSSDAAN